MKKQHPRKIREKRKQKNAQKLRCDWRKTPWCRLWPPTHVHEWNTCLLENNFVDVWIHATLLYTQRSRRNSTQTFYFPKAMRLQAVVVCGVPCRAFWSISVSYPTSFTKHHGPHQHSAASWRTDGVCLHSAPVAGFFLDFSFCHSSYAFVPKVECNYF